MFAIEVNEDDGDTELVYRTKTIEKASGVIELDLKEVSQEALVLIKDHLS